MIDIKQKGGSSQPFTRRDFLSTSLKAGAAALTSSLIPSLTASAEGRYNVLFIMVDDLRPLLGCYGHQEMHTPNIDRLAQRGTVFNRAYCQYPLCSPSRTSMLTGLRPDTTGVTRNYTFFRESAPDTITLPQHFKDNGYHSQSVGRVFHLPDFQDDENSWSVPSWRPAWRPFMHDMTPSWQALDVEDDDLRDGETAKRAVEVLKQIKNKQFFLALGFYKPHLPYNAPKKYYDLYDNETFSLPAILDENTTEIKPPNWNEIREFQDMPSGIEPLTFEKMLELVRAYAAATSYIDAQIGRVLDQLDELGLTEKTVIAFCGDHGYHLSENNTWGKNIIYETTLHSPLIVSMPRQRLIGGRTDALVELVDIFPTFCDACEIPILPELEGLSMVPIIEEPTLTWKTAAFSEYKQAHSMRTDQYRFTENGKLKELYDYGTDPNSEENIANFPENAALVEHLSEKLQAGWQEALPEIPTRFSRPTTLLWDINNDGVVDIQDLLLVSNSFGIETLDYPKADVNKDGSVDIIDLLLVASHLGGSSNGSAPSVFSLEYENIYQVENWLISAYEVDDGSTVYRRGIANLEMLINSVTPKESTLLHNYPNPFNPETWIPYDLAYDADILINIYNINGESVKQLIVGFQVAGTYRTKSDAVYWDGRNSNSEPVASGTYFYTLTALYRKNTISQPQFEATRRMIIVK